MEDALLLTEALSPVHLSHLDAFQKKQGLGSRAEALRLLLDIAIDVVTDTGDRFWDDKPARPTEIPRRR